MSCPDEQTLSPFLWECQLPLPPGKTAEALDDISAALEACGALSLSFETPDNDNPVLWESKPEDTYLEACSLIKAIFAGEKDPALLTLLIQQDTGLTVDTFKKIPDQDWSRAWLQYFQPQKITDDFWIIPSTDRSTFTKIWPPKSRTLHLDPGLAFGTGTHPSTHLCLEWIATHPLCIQDKDILDFGCGSGILSIAAGLFNAATVTAIDHDPQALIATENNRKKNPELANSSFSVSASLPTTDCAYDVILANILLQPLLDLAPLFKKHLKTGGLLVLSGLLEEQYPLLQTHYQQQDFHISEVIKNKEGWIIIEGQYA
jgi:ribosomal protein L11 methyltransferase